MHKCGTCLLSLCVCVIVCTFASAFIQLLGETYDSYKNKHRRRGATIPIKRMCHLLAASCMHTCSTCVTPVSRIPKPHSHGCQVENNRPMLRETHACVRSNAANFFFEYFERRAKLSAMVDSIDVSILSATDQISQNTLTLVDTHKHYLMYYMWGGSRTSSTMYSNF